MNRPARIAIAMLVVGSGWSCAKQPDATAPVTYSMEGSWNQSVSLTDPVHGITHTQGGYFILHQTTSGFFGSGQQSGLCHGAQGDYVGPLAIDTAFDVTNGTLSGRHVTFDTPACHYDGLFEAGNPRRIAGSASCSYVDAGTLYTFTGDWTVDR